jgi:hypothetical protein
MNGSEANADSANADDPTAWRPPFDALSAILQPGMPKLNDRGGAPFSLPILRR